jgi:hypothetical protein
MGRTSRERKLRRSSSSMYGRIRSLVSTSSMITAFFRRIAAWISGYLSRLTGSIFSFRSSFAATTKARFPSSSTRTIEQRAASTASAIRLAISYITAWKSREEVIESMIFRTILSSCRSR